MSLAIYPELGRYLTERTDTTSKRYSLGEEGIADVKRFTRRLERRQARLAIDEQVGREKPYQRQGARAAYEHRVQRAFLDGTELEDLRFWTHVIDARHGTWASPAARRAFIHRVVDEGACHVCGGWDC